MHGPSQGASSRGSRGQELPKYPRAIEALTKADSTLRSSQAVPDPSTNRALSRLTSEVEKDPVHSRWYGRQRITFFGFAHRSGMSANQWGSRRPPRHVAHYLIKHIKLLTMKKGGRPPGDALLDAHLRLQPGIAL